jgi:MtN3 and saliva related transmembrane protein
MDYMTIIGLAAAALGGISLFPQLLKVLKTKSTKDISLGMIIIFSSSIFLWLVYGNFDGKFAHHNCQFFWFYPSAYYPII